MKVHMKYEGTEDFFEFAEVDGSKSLEGFMTGVSVMIDYTGGHFKNPSYYKEEGVEYTRALLSGQEVSREDWTFKVS